MDKKFKYSIVVPVYNEEDNIEELYSRINEVFKNIDGEYEVIFIDDGSTDSTWQILEKINSENKRIKSVKLSRNFGHQTALSAGIDNAKGDAVITMDGDLQDPPEVIPRLIEKWKEGYAVVYARRKARKGEKLTKKIASWVFYRILKIMTRIHIPTDTGDFRLIDEKVADKLRDMKEHYRFIRGLSSWIGYKQTGIEFVREARHKGEIKYSFWKLLRLALNGITSFSTVPLQLATYMGFTVSLMSFLYALWVIIAKFALNRLIRGWTSLMVVILFLGGVQLIFLGIIGEYLGRTYGEVKERPLYIIEKSLGMKSDNNSGSE